MDLNSKISIIRAARDEIAKGWCKFQRHDEHANVCALGGIDRVSDELENYDEWVAVVGEVAKGLSLEGLTWGGREGDEKYANHMFRPRRPKGYYGTSTLAALVASWNNADQITQEDVLAHFDATIRRLEVDALLDTIPSINQTTREPELV